MKNILIPLLVSAVVGLSLVSTPAAVAEGKTKIVLVGDSTVASGGRWGDAFAKLLAPNVECVNLGRNGRSSKSYRDEGHWQKALDQKAGWVLIQFGHNDVPGKGPERETDAATTYKENMSRYVEEVRAAGGKPVLVTSVTRRVFKDGKVSSGSLAPYVEAVRALAAEKNVPLIDLHARSIEHMNEIGAEAALEYNAASKDPAKPDTTHLSPKGGEETARLVASEIRKNIPELAELLAPWEPEAIRSAGPTPDAIPIIDRLSLLAEAGMSFYEAHDH